MVELTGISRWNVLSWFLLGGFCARSRGGLTKSLIVSWGLCGAVGAAAKGTGEA